MGFPGQLRAGFRRGKRRHQQAGKDADHRAGRHEARREHAVPRQPARGERPDQNRGKRSDVQPRIAGGEFGRVHHFRQHAVLGRPEKRRLHQSTKRLTIISGMLFDKSAAGCRGDHE